MRITGQIEHPYYKITIMENMGKFILKIQADALEQTYRLRESETIDNAEDIKKQVTPEFLKMIDQTFLKMSDNFMYLINADTSE